MWRYTVIALAFAGCTNPDDILELHGTVVSVDPVEGQVVRLLRARGEPTFGYGYGGGNPCELAEPFKEMQASADGTFSRELFRLETRSATCLRVDTTFPSGSVAWADFGIYGAGQGLAPLRDWRPAAWLDGGVIHFEPPIPWPGDLPPVRMGIYTLLGIQLTHREQLVTADGGIAWEAVDRVQLPSVDSSMPNFLFARGPLLMDELRLEDFEGTLSLSALIWDPDQDSTISSSPEPTTRMRAGQRLNLRGTRVPLSRGLACPELGTPCPLTDGELTSVDAGSINAVAFRLSAPARISAVVLRGAWVGNGLIRVVLEPGDGGTTTEAEHTVPSANYYFPGFVNVGPPGLWFPDGGSVTYREAYVVIPVDAGVPSSQVTVQFPAGLARVQEISLFE